MKALFAIGGTILGIIGIYRMNVRMFSASKGTFLRQWSREPSTLETRLFDRKLSRSVIWDLAAIGIGMLAFAYAAQL